MSAHPASRPGTNGAQRKLAPLDVPPIHYPSSAGLLDGDLLEGAARDLLVGIAEDPERDGLLDTPGRVRKSLELLTEGYRLNPRAIVGDALFEVEYDEMVLLRDVEVYSLC